MGKVLHILPMNQLSGAEKMALLICKNLTQYEPIVVTGGATLQQVFQDNGIQSYNVNFSKKKIWSTIHELKDIIRRNKITILHTHDNTASLVAYLVKRMYCQEVKIISHIHNCYPWLKSEGINKKIDRYLRPRFDFNITCGAKVRDYYLKFAPYFETKKNIALSNAMDLKEIKWNSLDDLKQLKRAYGIMPQELVFGFIGRLSEQKGLLPFVDELAKFKDEFMACKFLIVGCGEQETLLIEKIHQFGLDHLFIFTGFQQDVSLFYQVIDIFFLPSLYEGLPMVLLEAMAYGKAVVSMNVGSIAEVLNENNGRLIEAGNVREFIEVLIELKQDERLVECLGKAAQAFIEKQYNINQYNEQLVQVYEQIEA